MWYLVITSLIWGFSFGLLKKYLVGVDPVLVSWLRLALALPLFLPLLRFKGLTVRNIGYLLLIGAIQYGLTYVLYIYAIQFLESYQVALFTVLTPLYVTLIGDCFEGKFAKRHFFCAWIAVLGALVIQYRGLTLNDFLIGFALMQVASITFAFGQIAYRSFRKQNTHLEDRKIYALLFVGAVLVTTLGVEYQGTWLELTTLTGVQWLVALYLGCLATGLGFYMWNVGGVRVNKGTLAVFNNLKMPLAVIISVLFFKESTDLVRLAIGAGVMVAAVAYAEKG